MIKLTRSHTQKDMKVDGSGGCWGGGSRDDEGDYRRGQEREMGDEYDQNTLCRCMKNAIRNSLLSTISIH